MHTPLLGETVVERAELAIVTVVVGLADFDVLAIAGLLVARVNGVGVAVVAVLGTIRLAFLLEEVAELHRADIAVVTRQLDAFLLQFTNALSTKAEGDVGAEVAVVTAVSVNHGREVLTATGFVTGVGGALVVVVTIDLRVNTLIVVAGVDGAGVVILALLVGLALDRRLNLHLAFFRRRGGNRSLHRNLDHLFLDDDRLDLHLHGLRVGDGFGLALDDHDLRRTVIANASVVTGAGNGIQDAEDERQREQFAQVGLDQIQHD